VYYDSGCHWPHGRHKFAYSTSICLDVSSLRDERGWHVTCSPCRHPLAFSFGRFKEPTCRFNFTRPLLQVFQDLGKFVSFVDDDLAVRGQPAHFTASRAPTRRKLAPIHPHLRSRSATRSRPFAVQSSGRQTCVNSPRMSRVPFLTHNLRADPPMFISARHPLRAQSTLRDSQRRGYQTKTTVSVFLQYPMDEGLKRVKSRSDR
jgi:hypothetical protein